jgi:hypothetical protein
MIHDPSGLGKDLEAPEDDLISFLRTNQRRTDLQDLAPGQRMITDMVSLVNLLMRGSAIEGTKGGGLPSKIPGEAILKSKGLTEGLYEEFESAGLTSTEGMHSLLSMILTLYSEGIRPTRIYEDAPSSKKSGGKRFASTSLTGKLYGEGTRPLSELWDAFTGGESEKELEERVRRAISQGTFDEEAKNDPRLISVAEGLLEGGRTPTHKKRGLRSRMIGGLPVAPNLRMGIGEEFMKTGASDLTDFARTNTVADDKRNKELEDIGKFLAIEVVEKFADSEVGRALTIMMQMLNEISDNIEETGYYYSEPDETMRYIIKETAPGTERPKRRANKTRK